MGALVAGRLGGSLHCKLGAKKMNIIELAKQAEFSDREIQISHDNFARFAALVAAHEREACVKECKKLIKVFLSSQYKTGQPLSSFGERHAVAACIEAIEARGTT